MDPLLEDPGWDEVLADGTAFAVPVADLRFAPHALSGADTHAFEALIEHAAALSAYPHVAHAPVDEHRAAIASVADAASGTSDAATRSLSDAMACLGAAGQWMALSNAIAARRLSRMLGVGDVLTAWWLRTAHAGLGVAFRALEERAYLRLRRGNPPVDDVVAAVG